MFYFVWSIRNAFPLRTIHRVEERNLNVEDKIKLWTYWIKYQIPSGYDNIKNMTHRMGESNRKGQDKIKHMMTEDITG
jgi:hypothetical protein